MITLQVGVKAFLRNSDGKYLLLHRSASKYGKTSGSWDIVGGRIEAGTKLIENLKREVKEETGLDVVSEPVLIAAQDIIPNAEKHVVRLTYIADCAGQLVVDTSEHTDAKWLSAAEIAAHEDLDSYVKALLNPATVATIAK